MRTGGGTVSSGGQELDAETTKNRGIKRGRRYSWFAAGEGHRSAGPTKSLNDGRCVEIKIPVV